ncbi:hypothetical protein SISSUDRAFT_1051700 [Sistotremastrum suecicum HHB10207 ss-3]|uniref:Fe2OG dioxygenase domain-containing protein n=1 Tax=Sistotremastrum suecicum HHB10207 ss-3 TaxID=1314776 RepID=A0A166ADW1_9AGAM|nr:hypothetical protein SISSUDRAFT_1051700 [Sistotremastrum suecicum HHB10207 ss-3]
MGHLDEYRVEDLPGADVLYIPDFIPEETASEWYQALEQSCTWYHPKLKVYGKEVSQSRSIAAYATDPSITVKYSGHTVNMIYTYPAILQSIQEAVEERLGVKFNHVMLNRYENGMEYIGRHRDTKENRVIASLSLGAVRTFIFTPTKNAGESASIKKIPLLNGSLLVMKGDTQKLWRHEIPKEPKILDGRISLTFRQLDL